jgi:hypothetical protein
MIYWEHAERYARRHRGIVNAGARTSTAHQALQAMEEKARGRLRVTEGRSRRERHLLA